jgi:AraC-like DNA-binding protein
LIAAASPRAFTVGVQSNDSEIEDLSAFFHGWPVEAIQLGARSERTVVSCDSFRTHRILRLEAGSALVIHGAVHKACSCVLLSASPEPAARFLGKPLRVTDLVLAGAGARLDLFVPIAAIVFILVVPASESIPPRSLQICDEGDSQGLIQYIKQHRSDGNVSLAGHLREVVATSQLLPVASARVSAVMSACRLIEREFPAALTLNELSRTAGVGDRTLEYGFREVYGTTPLNFVRSLRLTRSRMALLRATSYTPINEIASAFGFKHMGQYSRDYRRWFGETPSMTLSRTQKSHKNTRQRATTAHT